MIKMKCSNKECKHVWFDEKNNFCPKCSSKGKISVREDKRIKKIEEVIKNKKPNLK